VYQIIYKIKMKLLRWLLNAIHDETLYLLDQNTVIIKNCFDNHGILENMETILLDKNIKKEIETPELSYSKSYLLIRNPKEVNGSIDTSKILIFFKKDIIENSKWLLKTKTYHLLKQCTEADEKIENEEFILLRKRKIIDFTLPEPEQWIKQLIQHKYKNMFIHVDSTINLEVVLEIFDIWKKSYPFLSLQSINEVQINYFKHRMHIETKSKELFLEHFCKNNMFVFPHAKIQFKEQSSFWITYNEIFANQEFFFDISTETPNIVDCGANIGLGIIFWKYFYPNANILAFEPVPELYTSVQKNVSENQFINVEILPFALDKEDGEAIFFASSQDNTAGSLKMNHHLNDAKEILVQTRRLVPYLKNKKIHFLKIDIEGIEDVILEDIQESLSNVLYICCEFHDGKDFEDGRLSRIIQILEAKGFTYNISRSWSNQRVFSHKPFEKWRDKRSNMIFAKNKYFDDQTIGDSKEL